MVKNIYFIRLIFGIFSTLTIGVLLYFYVNIKILRESLVNVVSVTTPELELTGALSRTSEKLLQFHYRSHEMIEGHHFEFISLVSSANKQLKIMHDKYGLPNYVSKDFYTINEIVGKLKVKNQDVLTEYIKSDDFLDTLMGFSQRFNDYGFLKNNKKIKEYQSQINFLKDNEMTVNLTLGGLVLSWIVFFILSWLYEKQSYQLEKDLEESKMINNQISKLSAMGELSGGIAHEINSPLTVILSLSKRIVKKLKPFPEHLKIVEYAKTIEETTDRISKIIHVLKKLSREDSELKVEEVVLSDVVQEVLAITKLASFHKNVDISAKDMGNLTTQGNFILITQVFINLINNSLDEIGESQGEKGWIEISPYMPTDPNYFQVIVKDSGPGISEDKAQKIFKPYFTTKPIGVGTGLGLGICKKLMEQLGGSIEYQTIDNHTAFVLTFRKNKKNALYS